MAKYRSPLTPVEVAVLMLETPDGAPVFALSLPEPVLLLPLELLSPPPPSLVPSTPPRTAPMMIRSKIGRPIHNHLLRFFLGASYPRGEPAEAYGLEDDIGSV